MTTGLTIQQMAQELLRQSKAKQDYLVNTGSLSLSVTSDAPQLRNHQYRTIFFQLF